MVERHWCKGETSSLVVKYGTFEAKEDASECETAAKTRGYLKAYPDGLFADRAKALLGEIENRLKHIRQAIMETPSVDAAWLTEADKLRDRLLKLRTRLSGDRTLRRQNEPVPPSISSRVNNIVGSQWTATSPPTQTEKDAYTYAGEEFTEALGELKAVTSELKELEAKLEKAGAPWTPGRIPDWKIEVP